jgi:hypothetical protein
MRFLPVSSTRCSASLPELAQIALKQKKQQLV